MAFRTDIANPAAIAYERIRQVMIGSRAHCVQERAKMIQPTCDAFVGVALVQHFASVIAINDAQASVPGVAAYAQSIVSDTPGYDVVAEYNATRAAQVNARDNLKNMVPKDANGKLLYQSYDANGNLVNTQFTAAQFAPVVSLLDSVIASISP